MFITRFSDFAVAWQNLLQSIISDGAVSVPRKMPVKELLGVSFAVDDMRRNILVHPARNLNYRFMVAEWLWIAAGREDVATVAFYNKNMAAFSDDGLSFKGAYGPRLAPQIPYIIDTLARDADSRQAVASIWTPSPAKSRDVPCTISWQVLARDGLAHAIVNMRSSDVWLGLPYDFFNFSQLTSSIAGQLGLIPGSLTFNLGSSHLYDANREVADNLLATNFMAACATSPKLPGLAPADAMLNYDSTGVPVWDAYTSVLRAATKASALDILLRMEADNATNNR